MNEMSISKLQEKIFSQYMAKTPKSKQLYDRASKSLQSGVSAGTRFYLPYPIYMSHGKGSKIFDVDGNEYIDCFLSAGPLLLGHCHPEIMEAVNRELNRGLLLYNQELAVECAELLKEIVPCAEKVRFSNTGSEGTMFAVRAAKAFTGKNKVIKFYGHYHGLDDKFSVGTYNISDKPASGGINKEALVSTVLMRYGDIDVMKRKLEEDDDIAGVILDPQMSQGGIWPSSREYLNELRRLTREHGIVLIFDEVLTGFRLALGGAQEYFGVTPDLAIFGKAFDTGAKCNALVGKEEVMNVLAPKGSPSAPEGKKLAFHGGTNVDSTVGLAAAIAAMKVYKKLNEKGEYQRLFEQSERLKAGIEIASKQKGIPIHVNRLGPSLKLFFTHLEPRFETYCNLDVTVPTLFWLSLAPEGIYLNPALRSIFLSFVHTDKEIQSVIEAVNRVLDKYNFKEVLSHLAYF